MYIINDNFIFDYRWDIFLYIKVFMRVKEDEIFSKKYFKD